MDWKASECSIKHKAFSRGTWVVQSVKRPTSAQVKISQFVSLSPALGSVLTAQSLETTSDSVSPSLSAPTVLTSLSLSLSQKNKHLKNNNNKLVNVRKNDNNFKRFFFLTFIYFCERDRLQVLEGQRERGTQNPKQAPGSRL